MKKTTFLDRDGFMGFQVFLVFRGFYGGRRKRKKHEMSYFVLLSSRDMLVSWVEEEGGAVGCERNIF